MPYLLILLGILTCAVLWVGFEIRQVKVLLTPPPALPEVDVEVKVGEPAFSQTVSETASGAKILTDFQFSGRKMRSARESRKYTPSEAELAKLDRYLEG